MANGDVIRKRPTFFIRLYDYVLEKLSFLRLRLIGDYLTSYHALVETAAEAFHTGVNLESVGIDL